MPWPDRYDCPDCGNTITRPAGARAWGCHCSLGLRCRCRFLDADACYRCGTAEGFPRHEKTPIGAEVLCCSVLLHADQTLSEQGAAMKELDEKRRVYCDRCFHEQGFLQYSETEMTCLFCHCTGSRGATLNHVIEAGA